MLAFATTILAVEAMKVRINTFRVNFFSSAIRRTILFAALFSMCRAEGKVYIVTDTNDTTRISCLRGAIVDANYHGGKNTIILGTLLRLGSTNPKAEQVFQLTMAGPDETNSLSGDLNIKRGNLTIVGATPNIIINATGLGDRVFQVFPNALLTLENVVIEGGSAPKGSQLFANGESGGAIYNAGVLILENCVITNNVCGGGNFLEGNGGGTGGGDGGGIYNNGTLSASDCVISANFCGDGADGADGGAGGGIRNDGFCLLNHCLIDRNQSGSGGGPAGNFSAFGGSGGNGGGIFNSGKMDLEDCIIGENSCGQGASGGTPGIGPINVLGGWGGNGGSGAGIYNIGKMQIDFSTI